MSDEGLKDPSAGALLAQHREKLGLTRREVADALHLPMHVVEAIETDDSAHLPAPVFTRGYIRAYAKWMELDPDPLVTAYIFESQTSVDNPLPVADRPVYSPWRNLPVQVLAAGGGVVVLCVILLIWLLVSGDADEAEQAEEPLPVVQDASLDAQVLLQEANQESAQESAQVDSLPTSQQTSRQDSQQDVEVQDAPPSADADTRRSQPEIGALSVSREAARSEPVAQAGVVAVSGTARRLTDTGEDLLALSFNEDCWVEIRTINGGHLFADLGRAGQTRTFVGTGPFRLLLGYAPGASVAYNGERVALAPHTRNNLASLVVGQ